MFQIKMVKKKNTTSRFQQFNNILRFNTTDESYTTLYYYHLNI